jgi:hypothetical protein
MRGALLFLPILAGFWLSIVAWSRFTETGRVDACLDDGGAWDYEHGTCASPRSTP